MSRRSVGKPRYAVNPGELLCDFNPATWDATKINTIGTRTYPLEDEGVVGGSHDDPTHFLSGTGAVRVEVDNTTSSRTSETRINLPLDLSNTKTIDVWIYRDSETEQTSSTANDLTVELYAVTDAYGTNTNRYFWADTAGAKPSKRNNGKGWRLCQFDIQEVYNALTRPEGRQVSGSPTGLANVQWIYIKVDSASSHAAANPVRCWLDSIYRNTRSRAQILWMFDDGHITNLDAAAYMATKGIPATAAINVGNIAAFDYLTWANVQTLKDAGWTIINHSNSNDMLGAITEAQLISNFNACKTELIANGFAEYADCVVYPGNLFNLTLLGMMESEGYRWGRGKATISGRSLPTNGHPNSTAIWPTNRLAWPFNASISHSDYISGAGNGDMIKNRIREAIKYGTPCLLMAHVIVPDGTATLDSQIEETEFYDLVDFCWSLEDQGQADNLSLGEWLDNMPNGFPRRSA